MNSKIISLSKFNNGENSFFEILKNKDFLLLWLSQALSVFCAQLLNFVLAYVIFETTKSSLYVSLLFLFYLIPVFLLGLFAGVIVDHLSRRKIMIFTNLFQALSVLLYLKIGSNLILIYPVIFLYSIIDEFYLPAESAMLPTLVKKNHYVAANFMFTIASYGSLVVGFSMAGEIIKLLGINSTFTLSASLLFVAAIASFFIKKDNARLDMDNFKTEPVKKMIQTVKDNYRFVLKNKLVSLPIIVLLGFQGCLGIIAISIPKLATDVLKIDLLDLGTKLIFPLAIGSFFGAYFVDRSIIGNKKKLITASIAGSGIVLFLIGFLGSLGDIAYSTIVLLAITLGFFGIVVLITSQTVIQEETPDDLRGRVSGIHKFFSAIVNLVPVILAAGMVDLVGVLPVIFGVSLVVLMAGGISFAYSRRNFRKGVEKVKA